MNQMNEPTQPSKTPICDEAQNKFNKFNLKLMTEITAESLSPDWCRERLKDAPPDGWAIGRQLETELQQAHETVKKLDESNTDWNGLQTELQQAKSLIVEKDRLINALQAYSALVNPKKENMKYCTQCRIFFSGESHVCQ
jgi:hypothetical protein